MFRSANCVPKVVYVDPLNNSPRSDSSDDPFPHEDLPFNIEEQRAHVAGERWRQHQMWCDRLTEKQRMSHHNKRISLKILVSEAFQRDAEEARKRGVDIPRSELKKMWADIAQRVMNDMEHRDNSAVVLRNLSCMCVFVSDNICREYGENVEARQRRLERMQESISHLRETGSLFLDPAHTDQSLVN